MKTEVRTITPSIAYEMLKRNSKNRKLNESHCSYLAKQMKNNQWLFDAQPIRFSESGTLLDGQHRLNAVIESKKDIQFLIITGIKSEAFKVMDTGRNRNGADCLSILGIEYATEISSCARMIINFYKNRDNKSGTNKITNTDVLDWYEDNKFIVSYIRSSEKLSHEFSRILSRGHLASLMFLLSKSDIIMAEDFLHKLCTGLDLNYNSPIFVLRKKLILDKTSKAKLPMREKLALIIKSWNAFKLGKSIKVVRWNKETESFPNIL